MTDQTPLPEAEAVHPAVYGAAPIEAANAPFDALPDFLSDEDRRKIARLTTRADARYRADEQSQAVLERARVWFRRLFMRADHGRWRVSKTKALAYLTAAAALVAFWSYWPRPNLEHALETPSIQLGATTATGSPARTGLAAPRQPATTPKSQPGFAVIPPPEVPTARIEPQPQQAMPASSPGPSTPSEPQTFAQPAELPTPRGLSSTPAIRISNPVTLPSSGISPGVETDGFTLEPGGSVASPNAVPVTSRPSVRVASAPTALVSRPGLAQRAPLPVLERPRMEPTSPEPAANPPLVPGQERRPAQSTGPLEVNQERRAKPSGEPLSVTGGPPANTPRTSDPQPLLAKGTDQPTTREPTAGAVVDDRHPGNTGVPGPLETPGTARAAASTGGVLIDSRSATTASAPPSGVQSARPGPSGPEGVEPLMASGSGRSANPQTRTAPEGAARALPNPYPPGTRLAAKLGIGMIALGGRESPAVIVLEDGSVAFGKAVLSEAGRVQVTVLEVVQEGQSHAVNGQGLSPDGFPGLVGTVREDGPDAVSRLYNGALSGVSSYVQGLANAGSTTVTPGATTTSRDGASLGWSILGGLAQAFTPSPSQAQVIRYVELKIDTPFQVIFMPAR